MHIGLVIYGDLHIRTGGFLYDRKVVQGLRAAGHHVDLFRFPWRRYFSHLGDNFTNRLTTWLDQVRPDALIQDELVHPSLFLLNRGIRPSFRGPMISIVHHLRSSEHHPRLLASLYTAIERAYLKTVTGFITNSQATLASICKLTNSLNVPALIALPGRDHIKPVVSPPQIRKRAHQDGPLRLLYLGSIIPRKGLDTLLEALTGIELDRWRLDIVGDPTLDPGYTASLKGKEQFAAMDVSITWHGSLPDEVVDQLWADAHVLAMPSRHEGFGIVYLEAMANGLVPIASTAGGAGELIEHGRNGYLVDPGDASSLRSNIMQLLDDRDRLSLMGAAARLRYTQHPSWEETSNKIESFLIERIATYRTPS